MGLMDSSTSSETAQRQRHLTEAERRVKTIQAKFQGRRIHAEVLKYCKAELMQDNSFHRRL